MPGICVTFGWPSPRGGVPLDTLAIRYHVGGSLDEAELDMLEEIATIEEI